MNETAESKKPVRGRRKEFIGEVVSNKMQKTIVVRVVRNEPHPLYRKPVKRFRKFVAHDENQEAQIGDIVRIMETRPLSRTKRWRLVEIVQKAK
ncbi:MAG: 30S ribosomal protein S17 [Bacteroidia bacterium]|nr:30S ribosomal protein S17 [Bacteroidia bacterium]MCX7764865.1 30S ribosomal protein S17 [Bacteroidia bacterium]MDW8057182.1 30S ribosomal protein S17 [Bacteroidia bacterium]